MTIALRLLWRDWRGGELTLLLFSLVLATATITSISLFVSRIQNSIVDEASHFLAADAQIRGSLPMNAAWESKAQDLGLRHAYALGFRGMLFSDQNMQLGRVKAVSATYPLKGELQLSSTPFGLVETLGNAPPQGEVWLASRLFGLLDIQVGDQVQLGEATFVASMAIIKEPDSPQSFFGVAPRVLMNLDDIDSTQVIKTGSRIDYTWMLAGESNVISDFKDWLDPIIGEHHRWISIEESNRGIEGALKRAERFLLLAGSLCVVLSGLAIAIAARRYANRQSHHVALLKTFGVKPNGISILYGINLLILGWLGVCLGVFIGWLLHSLMLSIVSAFLPRELVGANLQAWLVGAISCFVALLAFAAPPLLALRQVPPAKVLRKNDSLEVISKIRTSLIGGLAVIVLIFWYSQSVMMTLVLSLGAGLCLLGVWTLANLLVTVTRKSSKFFSQNWRLGLANLQRHKSSNALQIMIFSVLFMLLFVMTITRTSLLSEWKKQIPEQAPNHFAFNIFPNEKGALDALFQSNQIERQPFYPMVRGRITQINDISMKERSENAENNMNYVRELNLTWSQTLGSDNKIVEGKWWQEEQQKGEELWVSAEQEYAKGLELEIGDTLIFSIAGREVQAKVASFRTVQWDSMNPNFFMIFSQPLLDGSTANWLTSFYLPPEKKPFLNTLARQFPTISIVELDQMLDQIRNIIRQVSLGIEFILLLILSAGFLVLITSVQATLDIRMQESAILRTLGANKKLVSTTLLIEFCSLGFLAGLLATIGAELMLYLLQTRSFELPWHPHFVLWLSGPIIGALLIGLFGWLSTRKVIQTAPLKTLRAFS